MTQEPVSLTTSDLYFHRTVSETPNPEYDLHCHPYYEVFYLLRGDVSYRIEGAEYALSPGMLLLMPPGRKLSVMEEVAAEKDRIITEDSSMPTAPTRAIPAPPTAMYTPASQPQRTVIRRRNPGSLSSQSPSPWEL